jgi:peptidoglycan/xylan/chitin deacetylase (PgdA/CDA1 family)
MSGVRRVIDGAAVRAVRPFVLSRVRTHAPQIALTFDDGPDPVTTLPLLEALGDARATFFALGRQVRLWPHVARNLVEMGHELASHGDAHERTTRTAGATTRADVRRAWIAISDAIGAPPRFYRPPHGLLSRAAWGTATALGMRPTLWTASARDWQAGATPDDVTRRVLAAARPGAIVLLHDAGGPPGRARARVTIQAMPGILAGLRERGLTPVTLSTLVDSDARVPVG